jgi:nicotinate-nucleotide adenylyltransferase
MTVDGQNTRIGVLGGTFDPPQNGHIAVAQAVFDLLHLDHVLFVPAGDPWQKNEEASPQQRVDMVNLAIAGHENFSLSTVDVDRPGPTYTVDTLRDLTRTYPSSELFFILGDEAFEGISSWKDYEELASLATFVVVSRHGTQPEVPAKLSPSVNLLEITALPISSTLCRERIEKGLSLEGLVPDTVAEYVEEHQLYRRNA